VAEGTYDFLVVLVVAIFVLADKSQACNIPVKMWLSVAMGLFLLDLFMVMLKYYHL
jgi:hypothetical protein